MPKDLEPNPGNDPVGRNIFRFRRKLNITQKELAAPEYSVSYISAIERGRIRPSLKALTTIALRLGVSTSELLAEFAEDAGPINTSGAQGTAGPASSLAALINQRHPSYATSLALVWASIAIEQHNPQLARELLDLPPASSLRTEQRLIRLYMLSRILLATGQPLEAQVLLEPIFQQDEFGGHAELLESCRFRLACAYAQQGKFLLASDAFSACIQAISTGLLNDPLFIIEMYTTIAEYYFRWKRFDLAMAHYRLALGQLALVSEPATLAEYSARLSQQHIESIHSSLAYWYATRSRSFLELAEAHRQITQAASNLGLALQELDKPNEAEQQLRQAIDLSERLGAPHQGILSRLDLADLLFKREEYQEAEKFAREAEARCRPGEQTVIRDVILYGRTLVTLGVINRVLGRLSDAESCLKQAIETLEGEKATETLEDAYFRYSELLYQRGETAEGYKMITLAYQLKRKRGERTS